MRPRLREQGYLAILAKHSAGRRPAVSSARVWPGGSVLAAYGVCSHGSGSVSVIEIRGLKRQACQACIRARGPEAMRGL